jgi:Tfp pilus assembly protein PilW
VKIPTNPRARRRRGLTLIEVMIAGTIFLMVLTAILSFCAGVARATDRRQVEAALADAGRRATDEVLLQARAATRVLPSQSLNGVPFATSGTGVVFAAPGYDAAAAGVILPAVTDAVAVSYDAPGRALRETIVPGAGSARPARTGFTIAENVSGVAFRYHVREQFKSAGLTTYTLKAAALAAPAAYVAGRSVPCTWNAAAPGAVTVASAPVGSDVQFVYVVSPTTNSGAALQHVNLVEVTLTLSDTDGRSAVRTVTLSGSARLRNQRS